MDFTGSSNWLFVVLQILFVDLLLGADNALVIALACRSLPRKDVRRAATVGIAGAIVLRLLMTVLATTLLAIPLVKLLSALALIMIAMNIANGDEFVAEPRVGGRPAAVRLWSAAAIIVVADAAMSIDNVVALAAIARGNFWLLAIGVALSLPVLGYGGVVLTDLLQRAPGFVAFGAAMLGWIGGDMAISDPLIATWANVNAPGLVAIAPALGAAFVFLYGRLVATQAPRLAVAALARSPAASAALPPLPPLLVARADPAPRPRPKQMPREDRVMIIGVIVLALVAGAFLVVVSYFDARY